MQYISEIMSFLVGLGAGWTLRVAISSRTSKTTQRDNFVGGDMAGGDINKK